MTEQEHEVLGKKQEAWMRFVKSPGCGDLKKAHHELKVLFRRCADKACEEWWEAKTAEPRLHKVAVSLGHGGSLSKN